MFLHPSMDEAERDRRLAATADVYVPRAGSLSATIIRPGSGIVGTADDEGRVLLHYDAGEADNIRTFADRVMHAAGRAATRYPTVATHLADADEVAKVGTYDPHLGTIQVSDEAALRQWLGVDRLDPAELRTTEGRAARRREIAEALGRPDLDPATRAWVAREAEKLGLRP